MSVLTKRLLTVCDMVPACDKIADIGTDHAFVPVFLIESGKCHFAAAGDLRTGPLKNASSTIKAHNLNDRIDAVLSNGFANMPDDCNVYIVAGMGGLLILNLINTAPFSFNHGCLLVLQPMSHEIELKKGLLKSGFKIFNQRVVSEGDRVYTAFSAEKVSDSPMNFDEYSLYFPDFEHSSDCDIIKYKDKLIKNLSNRYEAIKDRPSDSEEAEKLFKIMNEAERRNKNEQY